MVGTGGLRHQVFELEDLVNVEGTMDEQWDQWRGLIPSGWVDLVRDTKVKRYACPECKQLI